MKKNILFFLLFSIPVSLIAQPLTCDIQIDSVSTSVYEICKGYTIVIKGNPAGGTLPYTHLWTESGAGQLSPTNEDSTTFTAITLGTDTIVYYVTDATSTTVTDTIIITVNPIPDLSVYPSTAVICKGDAATLSASTTTIEAEIIWCTGSLFGPPLYYTPTINVSPSITTSYWAVAIDTITSCFQTKEVIVTVIDLTVTITATPNPICINDTSQLLATPNGGIGPYTYQWSPGTNIDNTTIANPRVWPTINPTIYTVTVTEGSTAGCSATSSVAITVIPYSPASVSIAANPNDTICPGTSVTFTATPVNGGTSPTYQWQINGSNIPGATNAIYTSTTLANNDSITCIMTSNALCVTGSPDTSNAIIMTVYPLPTTTLTSDDADNIFCAGQCVTFTASGVGAITYTFFVGVLIVQGPGIDSTYTTCSLTNGQSVYAVGGNGICTDTSNVITNTVNPVPVVNISIVDSISACGLCDGSMLANVSGGTPAYSYSWSTTSINDTVWNLCASIYGVTVTDTNGCTGQASGAISDPAAVPITLSSSDPNDSICTGECVTFTAIAVGDTSYTFYINGFPVQGPGPLNIFTSCTLNNLDAIVVTGIDTLGCTGSSNIITITVSPLPAVYNVTGGGAICAGDSLLIGLNGSQTGVYYDLILNGIPPPLVTVPGDNSPISFGYFLLAGTYSVQATNLVTGCTNNMADSAIVIVNPFPIPTITGPDSICINTAGNVYITEAGKTNYIWAVSGGTITAGGTATDSTVTVTWTTAGTQSVSINYTDSNGCDLIVPVIYNVIVNPLPVPTITGPDSICINTDSNVYITEAGMTNYVWTVSAGGTITAGGTATDTTVTVTWNTAGIQTVSVNYTDSNGCTAATPTVYNVIVNPLPIQFSVTGGGSYCAGGTGVPVGLDSSEAGVDYQIWIDGSIAGTIVAGTGNAISFGNQTTAGTYTVVATNTLTSCTNNMTDSAVVTINPLPVPTITGPDSICINTVGNVYITEAGMTNYVWTVSAGGTITAGGTATDTTVTVTWNTAGIQTVSVNYTDSNGCTAATPTVYNVTVNPFSVVSVSAVNAGCIICNGSLTVNDDGIVQIGSYLWSNGDSTQTITDLCPGFYEVTVTTDNGCKTISNADIYLGDNIEPLEINNTFSPNGDAINDKWVIKNIELYPDNKLIIINRWGNEVYSVNGYQNNWDGSRLVEGTYFYFLNITMCEDQYTFKGYVTIVR